VKDQVLIPWCQWHRAAWITLDLAAKKDYQAQLKTAQINVIWLRSPKQGLNTKQQLRILSRALEHVEAELQQHHDRVTHWEIGWKVGGSIKPKRERHGRLWRD
jgi:hypothetical protein